MKKIAFALSFPLVALLTHFVAREHASVNSLESIEIEGKSLGHSNSIKSTEATLPRQPRGSRYQAAWKHLPARRLSQSERRSVQLQLIREWVQIDLEGALEAIFQESWGGEIGFSEVDFLLQNISDLLVPLTEEVSALLATNGLELLESNMLKRHWLGALANHDPEQLSALLPSLSNEDFAIAGKYLNRAQLSEYWAQLRIRKDFPSHLVTEDHNQIRQLKLILHEKDLIKEYSEDDPNFNNIVTSLLAFSANKKHLDLIEQVPSEQATNFSNELLKNAKDLSVFEGSLSHLIEKGEWEIVSSQATLSQVRKLMQYTDPSEMAGWAANLPQREETQELFHRGVEPYIRQNPSEAWDWISDFELGLWRDRGFAEISQQALHHLNNPELSLQALEQIDDPAFKKIAEGWRRDWERK